MLDSDTKHRIDTARDILVGKVPDPKSQVEQITIALIYKFMDDMDAEAEELGGKRKFFTGDFKRYGWAKIMRSGLSGHETLSVYADGITKMTENPGVPPLFRDIFKNVYLPYRDPETLKAFLKVIDEFAYDHSERLGDAFEYLLSILGSQGDAGQFRTPRHIIDFIVQMVRPTKGDVILDPACGTAGFLISAYKYILGANRDAKGRSTLTPDERGRMAKNFKGYDLSPDMVRLSLVNLYLHGFHEPHVFEYDTLTQDERWNEFADVILANPPFMTPKGGIKPHSRFSISSRRSELLFLDYVIEHLTPTGRAGIIVPEGIHFVQQSAHAELRRVLVEKNLLLADITLPHGVFKPYASVKTHILIIDKVLSRRANEVLFVEIDNDGFSQTDTREEVDGTQLPAALDCVSRFKSAVTSGGAWQASTTPLRSYLVSKTALLDGEGCHLLGRWHDLPNRVIHKKGLSLRKVREMCDIRDGLSPNMATKPGDYVMVVPAEDRKSADHFDFDGTGICIPLVSSSGHGKADIKRIHYEEGKFALADTMCALFVKDSENALNVRKDGAVFPRYLHIYLNAMCDQILVPLMAGATNVTMSSSQLADILVPVPDIEQQQEVIESYLADTYGRAIRDAANALLSSSRDARTKATAREVASCAETLGQTAKRRVTIAAFMPR